MIRRRLSVWPGLPPLAEVRPPREALPYPLMEDETRLFALGRHALWHGVRSVGLGPGNAVLVPAYHHGSEVEALLRAGLECRFYGGDERLEPLEEELEELLDDSVRALKLTHYLGFPQDARRWRRWCDERGLLLLEDAAQAWLASRDGIPVGTDGDVAIWCLYKTVGVPEGAVLRCADPPPQPDPDPSLGIGGVARRHAAWAAQRMPPLAAAAALRAVPPYDHGHDIALRDVEAGCWPVVPWLLPRVADPDAAVSRRANYTRLLDWLGDLVPPPFDRLAAGASPFGFPVQTDDKPGLLRRLAAHGVIGMDFWSLPHPALDPGAFPAVEARRGRTVVLPVHQDLSSRDLSAIAAAVERPPRRQVVPAPRVSSALEDVREDWTRLADASGSIFSTYEWAQTWWRHYGEGDRLEIVSRLDASGRVTALLPLAVTSMNGLRVMRLVGHGVADQLAPVCAPEDRAHAVHAVQGVLGGRRSAVDLVLLERMPVQDGWLVLLPGVELRREPSPVLTTLGRTWEEYVAGRTSNMREQIRRRERKLAREHDLVFRLADDPDRLDDDLDLLFDLHVRRFGAESAGFATRHRAFHRDFAHAALRRGWLRLWFAEVDGRPLAAWYGFRFGGSDWFYQSGREPDAARLSVGFVLLVHTIRGAFQDGMGQYRFLRGGESYKLRFTQEESVVGTAALGLSAGGRAAAAGAAAMARTPVGRKALNHLAQ